MTEVRRTRAEVRVLQIETIKSTSRRLMSKSGAPALSLREVAREMGLVSSAIYRYFPTRDDLLTALIVDAYNDLGETAERAWGRSASLDARGRLHRVARAIRRWARANPHEYALIYGSPVPGYEAPALTVEAATRVTTVLARIVTDAWRATGVPERGDVAVALPVGMLERQGFDAVMPGVADLVRARGLIVWTQIFGFVSFELFGHYQGSVRRAERYFGFVVDEMADLVLPPSE